MEEIDFNTTEQMIAIFAAIILALTSGLIGYFSQYKLSGIILMKFTL